MIDQKSTVERIKAQLQDLRKQQREQVVLPSFKLMYQFGKLVEAERESYRQLHAESAAADDSKLAHFRRQLKERQDAAGREESKE